MTGTLREQVGVARHAPKVAAGIRVSRFHHPCEREKTLQGCGVNRRPELRSAKKTRQKSGAFCAYHGSHRKCTKCSSPVINLSDKDSASAVRLRLLALKVIRRQARFGYTPCFIQRFVRLPGADEVPERSEKSLTCSRP
jgi:hypothetical protein